MNQPSPIKRRVSRQIQVGNVPIGGDAPIAVQSMTNTETCDVEATVGQIRAIAEADSVVIDPHKHGLQPYGCGAVLFADPAVAALADAVCGAAKTQYHYEHVALGRDFEAEVTEFNAREEERKVRKRDLANLRRLRSGLGSAVAAADGGGEQELPAQHVPAELVDDRVLDELDEHGALIRER